MTKIFYFLRNKTSIVGPFLFIFFHFCLCYAVLSVPCSLVITYRERVDLLTLLYVMFACVFVTFPYGVTGQVWYLIVLIPDLCLPLYFDISCEYQVLSDFFKQFQNLRMSSAAKFGKHLKRQSRLQQKTNFATSFPIFEKIRYDISRELSASRRSHEISNLICYF